jgi:hypothetical protein
MPPMDLPPVQVEVVRLGLQGQPASQVCRSDATSQQGRLASSLSGSQPCARQAGRIRIDEPPGWPVLPPPPLTR